VNRIRFFSIGFLAGVLLSGFLAFLYLRPNPIKVDRGNLIGDVLLETPATGSNSGEILGKINLNHADANQLDQIPGIGEVKAESIIAFRAKYGNFVKIEELLYVPGISSSLLETINEFVYIE
jgi:competence ComEA-like helix-hairpin-helix protein